MNLGKLKIYLILFLLTVSGSVSFIVGYFQLGINPSYVYLAMEAVMLFTAFLSFNLRNSSQVISLLILFVFVCILSFYVNRHELGLLYFVNGLRDFLPYLLFPVIFLNIFQSAAFRSLPKTIDVFLYIFLIFQIPAAFLQFFESGAGDEVGGTLGSGGSGMLTFTIYLSTYYLMIRDFDHRKFMKSLWKRSYLLLFWIPTFINETKISFLMIILFFILLAPLKLSSIFKITFIAALIIPVLLLFNNFYSQVAGKDFFTDIFKKEYLQEYLLGNDNVDLSGNMDVPRLMKIKLALELQKGDRFIFGNGIGQFKGGSVLDLTSFSTRYNWLLAGSVPMSFFVFIQAGLVGYIVFVLIWFNLLKKAWRNKSFIYARNFSLYCTISFVIIQFYNDSLRALFFCCMMMYFMTFAASWEDKKEPQLT